MRRSGIGSVAASQLHYGAKGTPHLELRHSSVRRPQNVGFRRIRDLSTERTPQTISGQRPDSRIIKLSARRKVLGPAAQP